MEKRLSRSFPARLVALSFIGLILLGNCWFVLTVIGRPVPAWFPQVSRLALGGAIAGGCCLAALALRNRLRAK